ncbi:SDR family NAD(P)-dependent oxidoreductase [Amycolatopsis sp. cmx-11-32]|uniref:SDR family NAD(P)-dependent oxidoreductase n=1 Tax=Amycolatopsis sp. cmx-11-32 TaxID=2785796 RepID=UPI0039E4E281
MSLLSGKAVVITGSGRGLGRAFAHHAASQGVSVVVNDVDAGLADEVAREIRVVGGRAVSNGDSVADADWVRISLHRTAVAGDVGTPRKVTVAGRPADLVAKGSPALVEIRLSDADVRVLRIETSWTRAPRQDDQSETRLLGLAEAVLAGAFAPGPKLPATGERDVIERKTVEPGAGILDAPLPEISWKLCTQLSRALGVPAEATEPRSDGKCFAGTGGESGAAASGVLRGLLSRK